MSPKTTTRLKVTDTTLRDAHQSLIATRMRTDDMLDFAQSMDSRGFFSLEAWGGATFDTTMRFLAEDPWERLRKLKSVLDKTPIQMLLRGQNLVGYRHYPDDVVEKFVAAASYNGVDIFRVFDALNDLRNMKKSMVEVHNNGAHLQGTICYTTSPVHDSATFIKMAEDLYALECDSIAIKDMAGLITPQAAMEIVSGIKDKLDIMVCLHSHSTSGLAPMSYQAAIEAGVDIVDTAMSPFAFGTSQPPTESIIAAVQGTARDTGIDLNGLMKPRGLCMELREKYGGLVDPISERVDSGVLLYQLPGGMISNMISQLKEQDAYDRLEEVLLEIPQVREDLGFPPLVTPTSQIVGTQAILNVLAGERYMNVTKEVKDYVLGLYGKPPKTISEQIRRHIIGDAEVVTVRPADLLEPIYEKMKKEAMDMGFVKKEEDVLSYIIYPAVAPSFLKGERKCECLPPKPGTLAPAVAMPSSMQVEVDGEMFSVRIVSVDGAVSESKGSAEKAPPAPDLPGGVKSNMTGIVLKIPVQRGSKVKKGDTLVILEAMKMENPFRSPRDGTVRDIFVSNGDLVQSGDTMMLVD
ncbi:MAG: pyruvate/oxaloacetate carboxyltransferase [Candidatus Methanomethylophilaceae archaeon]